ncbi:TrmH family RNA methyltransferase [Namhaeicola litoreus]|uniref:TrmH family RNA methyltransferase n=1 Tax=Namhaeicola litoreus TaxID=1052145 RepID=A0ABW3Y5Y6_9FLAO
MYKSISSSQNPLVKQVLLLQTKSKIRKNQGEFVIEGLREIDLAIQGGYKIDQLLWCEELLPEKHFKKIEEKTGSPTVRITKEIYEKISHRKSTEGLIAIAKYSELLFEDIVLSENPLVLIAEAPEKPGNLGALLRTADAAHVDAVLIANPKTDLYNPNIIRSSVGCIFTNQIVQGSNEAILAFLKRIKIKSYAAALTPTSKPYFTFDFKLPTAIIVGTEDTGLSDFWLQNADEKIIIPMQGKIDSLNVSVSAAILIFEAKRQRNFCL